MVYPIHVYGSSVLKKVAEEIDRDYPNLDQLIKDMFETMYASDGVGLAAPQIGKSIRVFTIDTTPFCDDDEEGVIKVFINPEIYESFGEEIRYSEGCLSIPGLNEDVIRPAGIRIYYQDENFVEHDETFEDMAARVIQHEYDHLDGVVFTDRITPLRKQLVKSKLFKMSRGDFKARYSCKQVK